MAKVLRPSGKYVTREAIEKRRKILAMILALEAVVFGIGGYLVGLLLRRSPSWTLGVAFLALVLLLRLLFLVTRRKIEGLEQDQPDFSGQEEAYNQVRDALEALPDDFQIIHDLATDFGRVDHVVVGPTGVFCLATKAWKGEVSGDGNGELLWNRYPLDEPVLRSFSDTVARVKERLLPLTPGLGADFQPLLVFTSAALKVDERAMKHVQCISASQLRAQILMAKAGQRLHQGEIDSITNAFLGIAA